MESGYYQEDEPRTSMIDDKSSATSISGEGAPSVAGAGLEYDLWEGQFQFVGQNILPVEITSSLNTGGIASSLYSSSSSSSSLSSSLSSTFSPSTTVIAGINSPLHVSLHASPHHSHRLRAMAPRLTDKVQMIQEQMHALVDTQSVGEERYARVKQENATLQARILMLEEAAKDAETRADERLQAEQRRHREWTCHLERERQLQLENYAIKLQAAELESSSLRDEIGRLREQLERVRSEKARLETDLEDAARELKAARESERQAISRGNELNHLLDAAREEFSIRLEDQQKMEELEQQVAHLRARNKSLEEMRDELQAAAALQAGRELLMLNPCNSSATTEKGCPSLAVELLAGMNQDQTDSHLSTNYGEPCSVAEARQALKEQQEVNAQLRAYIDGILLNIVENYPQLLEVKQTH